jgi:RHS repeat-associated protein
MELPRDFIRIQTTTGLAPATLVYEEDLPGGFPFGALVRVTPLTTSPIVGLVIAGGALVDEWGNGNIEERVTFSGSGGSTPLFEAPGALQDSRPPRLARSAVGSPMLFHGQYWDADTGLLYLRARFYDPGTGMFLHKDPMGYEDSPNLYAGFAMNPTSRRDPSGLAIMRTSNGRVGAHYQKVTGTMKSSAPVRSSALVAAAGGAAKAPRTSPTRSNVSDMSADTVSRRSRADIREAALASAEDAIASQRVAIGTAQQNRMMNRFFAAKQEMRADLESRMPGLHRDFYDLAMQGEASVARLNSFIDSYTSTGGAFLGSTLPGRMRGMHNGDDKLIVVRPGLGLATTFKTAGHEFTHAWLRSLGANTPWGRFTKQGDGSSDLQKVFEEVLAEIHGVRIEVRALGAVNPVGKSDAREIIEEHGLRGLIYDVTGRYRERYSVTEGDLINAYFPGLR